MLLGKSKSESLAVYQSRLDRCDVVISSSTIIARDRQSWHLPSFSLKKHTRGGTTATSVLVSREEVKIKLSNVFSVHRSLGRWQIITLR